MRERLKEKRGVGGGMERKKLRGGARKGWRKTGVGWMREGLEEKK
jgi:hypothetical protein